MPNNGSGDDRGKCARPDCCNVFMRMESGALEKYTLVEDSKPKPEYCSPECAKIMRDRNPKRWERWLAKHPEHRRMN